MADTRVQVTSAKVVSATHWEGPLPPPEVVERFEKILPGSLDRLLSNFERESDNRRAIEKAASEQYHVRAIRGQWLSFALTLVAFAVAALCAFLDQSAIGCAVVGITVLGIVQAMMGGKRR